MAERVYTTVGSRDLGHIHEWPGLVLNAAIEPDAVAKLDAADQQPRFIARRGREHVPLDRAGRVHARDGL